LPRLPENELIELLCALADRLDELLYPPNGDARRICIWGKRLEGLCRLLPSSPSEQSPKQALISRAQAMMGMLSPSIVYLNSIEKWDVHNLHAAGTVMLAVACHRNLFGSLQLFLLEIPSLSNCTHSYIYNIIQILLSRTPNVLAVIPKAVQGNWSIVQIRNLGYFLLSTNSDPQLLMDIITELQANQIAVNRRQLLKTSYLLSTNDITTAQQLYHSIPPTNDYEYIHTGLYLAARAGNSKQAQTLFDNLKARGEVDKRDITYLLLSYAEEGDVREVYRVFNENFPKNDEGRRLNEPNVHKEEQANPSLSLDSVNVLPKIISAFLRQGNKVQAREIYDHMIKQGIQPSSVTYGKFVISYWKEGTPESLRSAEEFIKSLVSDAKEDHKWDKVDSKLKLLNFIWVAKERR
jgi:pentatricopeptide repeat protein